MTAMCGCLSVYCTHGYLAVSAGRRVAWDVGPVCDRCARTHMRPYVELTDKARDVIGIDKPPTDEGQ